MTLFLDSLLLKIDGHSKSSETIVKMPWDGPGSSPERVNLVAAREPFNIFPRRTALKEPPPGPELRTNAASSASTRRVTFSRTPPRIITYTAPSLTGSLSTRMRHCSPEPSPSSSRSTGKGKGMDKDTGKGKNKDDDGGKGKGKDIDAGDDLSKGKGKGKEFDMGWNGFQHLPTPSPLPPPSSARSSESSSAAAQAMAASPDASAATQERTTLLLPFKFMIKVRHPKGTYGCRRLVDYNIKVFEARVGGTYVPHLKSLFEEIISGIGESISEIGLQSDESVDITDGEDIVPDGVYYAVVK